jgi:hypothetical protein
MKIDIIVTKDKYEYYQATVLFDERIKSCLSRSFMYSIVDLGNMLSKIFGLNILSPEHELTIKLSHEK